MDTFTYVNPLKTDNHCDIIKTVICVHYSLSNIRNEKIFLQDLKKYLKKYFPGRTCILMYLADLKLHHALACYPS